MKGWWLVRACVRATTRVHLVREGHNHRGPAIVDRVVLVVGKKNHKIVFSWKVIQTERGTVGRLWHALRCDDTACRGCCLSGRCVSGDLGSGVPSLGKPGPGRWSASLGV